MDSSVSETEQIVRMAAIQVMEYKRKAQCWFGSESYTKRNGTVNNLVDLCRK
jgi:hypothetical protein